MLKQIKDCTIEQVRDYIDNKLSPSGFDIRSVSIDNDYTVVVEYYSKRGEPKSLILPYNKNIRVDEVNVKAKNYKLNWFLHNFNKIK